MNTSLVLTVLALCMTHVDSVGGTAVITIGPSNSTHANVSTPVTHSNSCECPIPVASTSPTKPLPPPPILVEPDTSGQLVGYKVVTCILCLLVFVVLIARFGRPSLKAFRKKMSDKRQSRWIGPTQSQSVSYHRGKTGVQHNDKTEKRSSFPGLERLTVNNSREPSSNRNSDYDSYNL